jgi:signal transduction histidine kinase/CheY-like chemotaxis protein
VSRPLQLVALSVVVLIVAVSVHQLLTLRGAIIGDTESQIGRLDMVFAEQTGRAVETVDFIVRNVAETLRDTEGTPRDRESFNELLRRRIAGVRQVSSVTVADASGTVRYASDAATPAVLAPAPMAALAWHKAHPAPGMRISEPWLGPDGRWTATLSRALHDSDGRFAGIITANFNLLYFEDFYRAVELGESGSIILFRRDGIQLARYPHLDATQGRSWADLPPFKDVLAHAVAGTLVMESPLDGRIRIIAIRALRAFPLAVMVSIDQGALLADWRREAWTFAGAAICLSIVMVGLLLLLANRSRLVERVLAEAQTAHAEAEHANGQMKAEMAERERAEAALRQAQRIEAIGQLTGGVAHDFNNLLTVVLGNLELLQRGLPDLATDVGARDRLTAIRSAAERGATLTSHLLAFARRQPLLARPVDLNGLVTGMQELLDSALGRGAVVQTRLAPDLWHAMVDPTQIELVVLNLAINARDAMPPGGTIVIQTENVHRSRQKRPDDPPPGDYVQVSVRDTGSGMTGEVKARAFEPFFTTKPPGAGSGLGLSQVFGTARQLGGGVHIETELNRGTTVSVLLPRAAVPSSTRPVIAPPEPRISLGATVLLVDDQAPVRSVVAATLRDLGYAVREAGDAEAALIRLREDVGIDVLLTDLAMPGMSGIALAEAAQRDRPDIAIVYISGYADAAALTEGAARRRQVGKPVNPADLRTQIEGALRERRSASAPASPPAPAREPAGG